MCNVGVRFNLSITCSHDKISFKENIHVRRLYFVYQVKTLLG